MLYCTCRLTELYEGKDNLEDNCRPMVHIIRDKSFSQGMPKSIVISPGMVYSSTVIFYPRFCVELLAAIKIRKCDCVIV